jgi:hypothetical protein
MERLLKSPKVATIHDVGQNFEETVKKNAKIFICLIFLPQKAHLRFYVTFPISGHGLARFWAEARFGPSPN